MCPESERGTYIGHSHTHTRGIKPDDENVSVIKDTPARTDKKGVERLLWYRQLRWKVQRQSGNCH